MTREELLKAYYDDRPTEPYSSDDCPTDWSRIAEYAENNLEKAYSRIAELEKENEELKSLKDVADLIRLNNSSVVAMAQLNNNNVALRKENAELKEKWQENDKAWWEGFNTCKEKCGSRNVELTDNFTKATKIIKELLFIYYDPLTTESDVKHHHKILADARQFLKDSEVH